MKRNIIGAIGIIAAIILAFVTNVYCQHTDHLWQTEVFYLAALFLFQSCWCSMCVLEKQAQDIISVIGANLGLPILIFCFITAFLNIKWWVVLLFIPFAWLFGGLLGGIVARKLPAGWIYFLVAVGLFSAMINVFYKV